MHHFKRCGRCPCAGSSIFPSVLALLLKPVGAGVVACWHARASVDNEMRMALEAATASVDNALLSCRARISDPYLEGWCAVSTTNRHVRVALIEGGREIAASRLARP